MGRTEKGKDFREKKARAGRRGKENSAACHVIGPRSGGQEEKKSMNVRLGTAQPGGEKVDTERVGTLKK